jgi:hypothetical protein
MDALHQMSRGGLDPARVDGGNHARVDAGGFNHAARDDPARSLRCERCSRRNDEPNSARAGVLAPIFQAADGPEKTRENCLVKLGVARLHFIQAHFQLADGVHQLRMQVVPFTHAHE